MRVLWLVCECGKKPLKILLKGQYWYIAECMSKECKKQWKIDIEKHEGHEGELA